MFFSGTVSQYYATICGNLATVTYAIAVGWSSPNLPLLLSDNTPLGSGPLSLDEASWVSSLLCFGGLFGTIILGWIADKFGRKLSGLLMGIPIIVSWILIAFATNVYYLYVARFIVGFGGGGTFVVIPLYVSEISEDTKRGSLGSILMQSNNIGILIGYIAGSYMDYQMMALLTSIVPTLFLIFFYFLPETPRYLLIKNKIEEAENSLKYFRSHDDILTGKFQREFQTLKLNLMADKSDDLKDEVTLKDFKSTAARKAVVIAFALLSMTQFGGVFPILNYTSTILRDAGSNIEPNLSSIIVATIQVIGAFISSLLVDRAGRRFLLLTSFVGTGLGHFVLGFYLYCKSIGYNVESYTWIPVVSVSEIMFVASLGVQTLPFLIVSEIFPQKTRGLMVSSSLAWSWVLSFLLVKYFIGLVSILGLHGCIGIFCVCCFLAAIFVYFYMPETKGISIEDIIKLLNKTK